MTTAFQIGAFQFDAFQEDAVGSGGAYRPVLQGWGLRHALELMALRRKRALEALAREQQEREAREAEQQRILAEPVLLAQSPRTLLKLKPTLLDVDAELEEFGALMKMVAELEEIV